MNRNVSGVEPHLKVVARPSLYTTETPLSASEKPVSILASLEPESPERKINRQWVWAALTSLVVAGISYWAYVNSMYQHPILIPAWIETALNISNAPIPVAHPNNQLAIPKQEKPVEIATEEARPATIVTEPAMSASTSPSPVVLEPSATKPEPTDKIAKLESDTGKKKNPEQAVATATAQKPATASKPEAIESVAHKTAAAPKVEPKAADTHTNKPAKAEVAKNGKDEDVDLIAALLNRVSHQDTTGKDAKPKKSSTQTAQSNSAGTGAASAKRQNKTDPNRDIVTRTDGDTTESLIKRCKALGFFEGELCRIRICSSLWGKDPACPAPEQVALPNPN